MRPSRSRRSHMFRPGVSGLEMLERLRLLDASMPGDDPDPPPAEMDPAVLPDPSDYLDSNTTVLVNLDTFTGDANNLEMQTGGYAAPGGIEGKNDGNRDALVAKINAERNGLLANVDAQITSTTKVRNGFAAMKSMIQGNKTDHIAERNGLGNSVEDLSRKNYLTLAIEYETDAIDTCTAIVNRMNDQITSKNGLKVKINEAFDRLLNSIKVGNVSADPEVDFFAWYYTDADTIG